MSLEGGASSQNMNDKGKVIVSGYDRNSRQDSNGYTFESPQSGKIITRDTLLNQKSSNIQRLIMTGASKGLVLSYADLSNGDSPESMS